MIRGLDLFSGIGGITYGLRKFGVQPIAYCERDRYVRRVLLENQFDNLIPRAPIWNDVRTLKSEMLPQLPDIIYGGFPCQDISVAGNGKGLEGERSGLFFQIMRLVGTCRPRFVFLENVPAITVRGLDRVLLEFAALGYDARWTIVSAAEVGAPHLRERWWLLAHTQGLRCGSSRSELECKQPQPSRNDTPNLLANAESIGRNQGRTEREVRSGKLTVTGRSVQIPNTTSEGLEGWLGPEAAWLSLPVSGSARGRRWPPRVPKPTIRRNVDGLSSRVEQLKSLGNAVVPQAVEKAFSKTLGLYS